MNRFGMCLAAVGTALTVVACAPSLADNRAGGTEIIGYDVAGSAVLHETPASRSIACEDVLLFAARPNVVERIDKVFGSEKGGYAADWKVRGYAEIAERLDRIDYAECSSSVAFVLHNVSRGEYYLVARATWLLRWQHNGGYLARRVSITKSITDIDLEK
jgi:hypothetical protein